MAISATPPVVPLPMGGLFCSSLLSLDREVRSGWDPGRSSPRSKSTIEPIEFTPLRLAMQAPKGVLARWVESGGGFADPDFVLGAAVGTGGRNAKPGSGGWVRMFDRHPGKIRNQRVRNNGWDESQPYGRKTVRDNPNSVVGGLLRNRRCVTPCSRPNRSEETSIRRVRWRVTPWGESRRAIC